MESINYNNILEQVTKRNRPGRLITLIIGSFIVAFIYNAFIVPNNIVYGGIGGLAIIVNKMMGITTTLFINVVTIILILISFFLLGVKKTSYSVVGFLTYTVMINITAPLVNFIDISFDSFLFSILIMSLISGLGYGLIYRTGFNTGGSDSIVSILQKYVQLPTAKLSNIINGIIIVIGATTFGYVQSLYAIVFLQVMNFISDRVVLGMSNSKVCFIKSNKLKTIEEYLTTSLEVGYTLIDSTNGIGFLKKSIIMCVVPSDRFYDLKQQIISIDKHAFLISNDCYTVEGGYTNHLIPF